VEFLNIILAKNPRFVKKNHAPQNTQLCIKNQNRLKWTFPGHFGVFYSVFRVSYMCFEFLGLVPVHKMFCGISK